MWREMFKMGLAFGLAARIASMDSSDVRALLRMGKRAAAKAREWFKPVELNPSDPHEGDECISGARCLDRLDGRQCVLTWPHKGTHIYAP